MSSTAHRSLFQERNGVLYCTPVLVPGEERWPLLHTGPYSRREAVSSTAHRSLFQERNGGLCCASVSIPCRPDRTAAATINSLPILGRSLVKALVVIRRRGQLVRSNTGSQNMGPSRAVTTRRHTLQALLCREMGELVAPFSKAHWWGTLWRMQYYFRRNICSLFW